MADIPEDLLRRSAEAKAKALGLPVEQVLAEMKGERPPPSASDQPPPKASEQAQASEQTPVVEDEPEGAVEPEEPPTAEPAAAPAAATAVPAADVDVDVLVQRAAASSGLPANLVKRSAEAKARSLGIPVANVLAEMAGEAPPAQAPAATESGERSAISEQPAPAPAVAEPEPAPAAVATAVEAPPAEEPPSAPPGNGGGNGNGRKAAMVSARPVAAPANVPEGVRTQRLLTVVKARAIQNVKAEPTDKVNTWPHLMLVEFVALLAMTGFLLILSVILQAPLLEPANFNATPNPSKAPWYFLGLQELLSYFDPQIAGVTVPTIIGLIGFMMIPYIDRNPSTKPSDRKFAIMLYTIFLTGSATLTILGVLFRGKGFNFAYPWRDGIFFDDLKDWVHFE
jgi:menaquinol-cytochrome c reductase cytochrome b/c subunit